MYNYCSFIIWMFGSTAGFDQEIRNNSAQPHTMDEDSPQPSAPSQPMSYSFLTRNFLHRATQLCSSRLQTAPTHPYLYACLGNDELSQLLAIQGPFNEGEPVLLEFHARALGSLTDMISDAVFWCRI